MSRIVSLDTETTGLDPKTGDRLVEIGCIELVNRRITGKHFHCYINPERDMPYEAQAVHGLSSEFLSDKPLFANVMNAFLAFIEGAEVVIHNAPFDIGFLNNEMALVAKAQGIQLPRIGDICEVTDSLVLARQKHPGQKNSLDALCNRYGIDNAHRELHGAYLDADILAKVYLAMTGGQTSLLLADDDSFTKDTDNTMADMTGQLASSSLPVVYANHDELQAHEKKLATIAKTSGGHSVWAQLNKQ